MAGFVRAVVVSFKLSSLEGRRIDCLTKITQEIFGAQEEEKNQDEENDYKQDTDATNESQTNVQATENKSNAVEKPKTESKSTTMSEGESNAEQYPAKPGAMLYDKTE